MSLENFANTVSNGFPTIITQESELEVWNTIQKLVKASRSAYKNSSEFDYRLI